MQIFILGKTKSGKSALAQQLQKQLKGFQLYEAGSWARKEFAKINTGSNEELCREFKDNLTAFALGKLKSNPLYSYHKYLEYLQENKPSNLIVAGVRNPVDFENMKASFTRNAVIYLDSEQKYKDGAVETFEKGIDTIISSIKGEEKSGLLFFTVNDDEDFKQSALNIASQIL